MQAIIQLGGITDTLAKKDKIIEFVTDQDTKDQWKGFDSYSNGTFDEFIAEIEDLYPELEDVKVGSLQKLRKICKENQDIEMSDAGRLKLFSKKFETEAAKLMKPPASISNGELVGKFLECLDEKLEAQVLAMMVQHQFLKETNPTLAPANAAGVGQAQNVKRRGDVIPLADVLKIAKHVVDIAAASPRNTKSSSSGSGYVPTAEPGIKKEYLQRLETLSQEVSHIKDGFEVHKKEIGKTVADTIQQSFAQIARQAPPHMSGNAAGSGIQNNRTYGNNNEQSGRMAERPPMDCFYCKEDHPVATCPHKEEHIKMGYITFVDGAMRLGNGSFIPKFPDYKSKKERVDDYYAGQGKPRGAPLGKRVNQQFSQGYIQNGDEDQVKQLYDSRDDELLALRVQLMNQKKSEQSRQMNQKNQQQFVQVDPESSNSAGNAIGVTPDQIAQMWEMYLQTRSGAGTSSESGNF